MSAGLIATIRRGAAHTPSAQVERPGDQLRSGLRLARTTSFALPLGVAAGLGEVVFGAQTVQLVVYADRISRAGPAGYGYLLAAAGVGGVLSALVNGRLASSWRVSLIVVGTAVVSCATQSRLCGDARVRPGAGDRRARRLRLGRLRGRGETALARIVPPEALGRLMGMFDGAMVAAAMLGAVVAPVLIRATSLTTSLVATGVVTAAGALACLPRLRGLDVVSRQRMDALPSD